MGRISIVGQFYSITKCCHDNQSFLIPNNNDEMATKNFEIISNSISWLNDNDYWKCYDYVIMPNHIHLIFRLGERKKLGEVMHSFSSFTAHEISKNLGRTGAIWQDGYYDHALRDEDAYLRHVNYIAENPVRAGLVVEVTEWPFTKIDLWTS